MQSDKNLWNCVSRTVTRLDPAVSFGQVLPPSVMVYTGSNKIVPFSQSTDVTSTDLVSAKGKTKDRSVLLWYSCFDRSILMFLMRGLQCRISISKHCLMKLWNDINQLTFVFPFAETRSIKRMSRQLAERIDIYLSLINTHTLHFSSIPDSKLTCSTNLSHHRSFPTHWTSTGGSVGKYLNT